MFKFLIILFLLDILIIVIVALRLSVFRNYIHARLCGFILSSLPSTIDVIS